MSSVNNELLRLCDSVCAVIIGSRLVCSSRRKLMGVFQLCGNQTISLVFWKVNAHNYGYCFQKQRFIFLLSFATQSSVFLVEKM